VLVTPHPQAHHKEVLVVLQIIYLPLIMVLVVVVAHLLLA
jgi:hypothetical protein